jgi:preprotein translocase subunit SecG
MMLELLKVKRWTGGQGEANGHIFETFVRNAQRSRRKKFLPKFIFIFWFRFIVWFLVFALLTKGNAINDCDHSGQ